MCSWSRTSTNISDFNIFTNNGIFQSIKHNPLQIVINPLKAVTHALTPAKCSRSPTITKRRSISDYSYVYPIITTGKTTLNKVKPIPKTQIQMNVKIRPIRMWNQYQNQHNPAQHMVISHVAGLLVASILVLVMKQQKDASLKELNLYFNIMNVKLCLLNQEIGIQLFYQIIQHRFHFT